MEWSLDMSLLVIMLSLSGVIVGYYRYFHQVPLRHKFTYERVVLPIARQIQPPTKSRLLRVRRKIIGLKSFRSERGEEAPSSSFI
ncbi:hypothetical protein GK047_21830 [Paenibacillus sp. SYP-B3998]|uniref:Uncharacterized protein n=1 Tax=Paenibacillus sp. SYP-B3998 TaxID=2678564 RepID=A0A6G4A2T5_9BACL|nr:hypothetical protein [Paenibacillus sp. SYP-B3998]NEW08640.1 hypothetical protein [Paenibacillus sp. SYP-B3998]